MTAMMLSRKLKWVTLVKRSHMHRSERPARGERSEGEARRKRSSQEGQVARRPTLDLLLEHVEERGVRPDETGLAVSLPTDLVSDLLRLFSLSQLTDAERCREYQLPIVLHGEGLGRRRTTTYR